MFSLRIDRIDIGQLTIREFVRDGADVSAVLQEVLTKLDELKTQGEELKMALSASEQAIVDRFNTATNAIAAKIQSLIDNPPAKAEFDAALTQIVTGLENLGAPSQPIPGPGPQPTP